MKKLFFLLICLYLIILPSDIRAQAGDNGSKNDYVITDFSSDVEVQKDTSLSVTESIKVNFPSPRHGIYRIIPVTYYVRGKTLNTKLKVVSIKDSKGNSLPYEKSRRGQSISLKIGSPDAMLTGLQTYIISYEVERVVERYATHDEIYWNVTGSEWDTDILSASTVVSSPYAKIIRTECFAGPVGTTSRECVTEWSDKESSSSAENRLGYGQDFTVVVALAKNNELVFPSKYEIVLSNIVDNWGYLFAFLPFGLILYFWYKKGRDRRYSADTVYYKLEDAKETLVNPFVRKFLPMIYHPIQGLTPSQVGTIVDDKVDIHDIVAEIVELARLGFLRIEKVDKAKLIGKETDYVFFKLEKDISSLKDYQLYLLTKLFDEDYHEKMVKELEKLFKNDDRKLKETIGLANQNSLSLLSSLKNKFYLHLEEFRKELYKSLDDEKIFEGKPDSVRAKWIGIFIAIEVLTGIILFTFLNLTANYIPLVISGVLSVPSFFFAYSMPRKTAWGYSLLQQIKGLSFYLKKGKWRVEVAEKHLFFEEMIPLAISLGVIDKLTRDMADLGVASPSYFVGSGSGVIYSDLRAFESSASSNLLSAPGGKGSSSWSGGSGFSGGSSGGGFGGGGGGSW